MIKYKSTGYAESASSCESDIYASNRLLLAMTGVQIKTADLKAVFWLGIPFLNGAKIVLAPSFAVTINEIRSHFPTPDCVIISDRSSLVLEGDVIIETLDLDGDLHVTAAPGAQIIIRNLSVKNDGVHFVGIDKDADEISRIRGYRKRQIESLVIYQGNVGQTIIDRPSKNNYER